MLSRLVLIGVCLGLFACTANSDRPDADGVEDTATGFDSQPQDAAVDVGPPDDTGEIADAAVDVTEDSGGSDTEGDVTEDAPGDTGPPERRFVPAPATLHRLSSEQVRASIHDLLGVVVTGDLEADTSLHGFVSVAGSELTIAPRTAEQLEEVAWEAANALVADAELRSSVVRCDPADPFCMRFWALDFGRSAWRRPLTSAELERVVATAGAVAARFDDPWMGVSAAIALFLQSPHFVFRVEVGEPDPDTDDWRRYTDWEMASRLSYFLLGSTPDQDLLAAAAAGALTSTTGLAEQTARLLEDPRARVRLTAFFDEFIGLQRLDDVAKDSELFPQLTPELRAAMRFEVQRLFAYVAFDEDLDFREILTTNTTFVSPELAALYGIEGVADGVVQTELPASAERGGLLGRAAVLALFSHATVNSPTFRGRFIRAGLLCHDVPPPPDGVVTELPEPDGVPRTLRERLEAHATEPLCAGCHELMDPLGFPLEEFDPIGQWRDADNGLPIDASGELDGTPLYGAVELGAAVAAHDGFSACVTRRLYRHATGHLETFEEFPLLNELAAEFAGEQEHRFLALVLSVVLSDGFRKASAPRGLECDDNGATRPCTTACNGGIERCAFGEWTGCTALAPSVEVCNGIDDDCDEVVDEGIVQTCTGACGLGTTTCTEGDWSECGTAPAVVEVCDGADQDCDGVVDEDIPETTEICDGVDQDCDGRIDEAVPSAFLSVSYWDLNLSHPTCSSSAPWGPGCNAAINRYCANHGCASTGFGPVEIGPSEANLVCLANEDVTVHATTYTQLEAEHPGCTQSTISGSDCNAAIHRWCGGRSQTTGFGPLEHSGDSAQVACVPDALVISTSYTVLATHHPDCTPATRVGPQCSSAINRYCRSLGHLSGFGPVENSGDFAAVSCVPTP